MEELQKHFLHPAALFASKTPTLVSTILGTCVAICLYDPISRVGGINHFMLASWDGSGLPSLKYGDHATRALLEKMLRLGADKRNIQARVYGGLCRDKRGDAFNIGEKNINVAYSCLSQYHIPILAKDVGGCSPRKLSYQTHTGQVIVNCLLPEKLT